MFTFEFDYYAYGYEWCFHVTVTVSSEYYAMYKIAEGFKIIIVAPRTNIYTG